MESSVFGILRWVPCAQDASEWRRRAEAWTDGDVTRDDAPPETLGGGSASSVYSAESAEDTPEGATESLTYDFSLLLALEPPRPMSSLAAAMV